MQTVKLGSSDLVVGEVAYGCWRFASTEPALARELIETALDCGLTLIDTAEIYGLGEPRGFGGAEELLGEILADAPQLRSRMVLATKGGITPPVPYDSSATYITSACENSLRRLGVEQIDLYQIHRPDLTTPFEELAGALNRLKSDGKIAQIGVSNFTAAQTRALNAHLDAPLVTVQPEFSALQPAPLSDGVFDLCQEMGFTAMAWSPLAGGRLAQDTVSAEASERERRVHGAIGGVAAEKDCSRSAVALAFVRSTGTPVIPIIGTQTPERIRQTAKDASVRLTKSEFYRILIAWRGEPMP